MDFLTAIQVLDSTIRLATPLLLACLEPNVEDSCALAKKACEASK